MESIQKEGRNKEKTKKQMGQIKKNNKMTNSHINDHIKCKYKWSDNPS